MKTYIWCLCVVWLLIPCICGYCANAEMEIKPQSVFYKELPDELKNEIKKTAENILAKETLTVGDKESANETIEEIDLKRDYTKEQGDYIQQVGRGVLPIITELLISQDANLRKKAQLALVAFRRPSGILTKEYLAETDAMVILLCRRSLLDNEYEIRLQAMATLCGIGLRNTSNIPAGVVAGFEQALSDPDPRIRKQAHCIQVMLGLVPREPSDIWM